MLPITELHAHLCDLEKSLLLPDVRQSEWVSALLADDFMEFGSSGRVFDKARILASMRDAPPVAVTATEFKVQVLSPDVALVTYVAVRHGERPVRTLRSSVWRYSDGQWTMTFHQGTVSPPES